jgi:hypothetical protein
MKSLGVVDGNLRQEDPLISLPPTPDSWKAEAYRLATGSEVGADLVINLFSPRGLWRLSTIYRR